MPDILDVVWTITRYAIAMGIGAVLGVVFTKNKTKKGHTVPVIEKTTRNFTLMTVVLMVISLVAVGNTAYSANKQATCNSEFRRVIKERSDITIQDGVLRDKLDDSSSEGFDALHDLVLSLLSQPPLTTEQLNAQIGELNTVLSDNLDERQQIKVTQKELADQRARNPYPDPRC